MLDLVEFNEGKQPYSPMRRQASCPTMTREENETTGMGLKDGFVNRPPSNMLLGVKGGGDA